jgi:hypothetical protein
MDIFDIALFTSEHEEIEAVSKFGFGGGVLWDKGGKWGMYLGHSVKRFGNENLCLFDFYFNGQMNIHSQNIFAFLHFK